jgi:hypothetical protein
MRTLSLLIALSTFSACATTQASGPTLTEVQQAFAELYPGAEVVRARCHDFAPEEPTEAECAYAIRKSGKLIHEKTYFFVDATGWHLMESGQPHTMRTSSKDE